MNTVTPANAAKSSQISPLKVDLSITGTSSDELSKAVFFSLNKAQLGDRVSLEICSLNKLELARRAYNEEPTQDNIRSLIFSHAAAAELEVGGATRETFNRLIETLINTHGADSALVHDIYNIATYATPKDSIDNARYKLESIRPSKYSDWHATYLTNQGRYFIIEDETVSEFARSLIRARNLEVPGITKEYCNSEIAKILQEAPKRKITLLKGVCSVLDKDSVEYADYNLQLARAQTDYKPNNYFGGQLALALDLALKKEVPGLTSEKVCQELRNFALRWIEGLSRCPTDEAEHYTKVLVRMLDIYRETTGNDQFNLASMKEIYAKMESAKKLQESHKPSGWLTGITDFFRKLAA